MNDSETAHTVFNRIKFLYVRQWDGKAEVSNKKKGSPFCFLGLFFFLYLDLFTWNGLAPPSCLARLVPRARLAR